VIQNFEFTYELCWKFMKRWLSKNLGSAYVDGIPRYELFRLAGESLLIDNVSLWMDYHDARNETSHVYDKTTAGEVFAAAVKFSEDAKKLLANIEKKND
ncbi:MAG: HI0074 family nucleotidyltransferase substrate-binding subunit, partial [Candidatus Saganbacteria bacterium]|nr:HI0074 family nucleotidyltransferase substrate-binding subunit [Candidatus Saganbacteria bacterium]